MPLPSLLVPREEAKEKIATQIQKGQELLNTSILATADLDAVRKLKSRWVKFTTDLLKTLFSNHSLADEFAGGTGYVAGLGQRSFREQVDELRESIDRYLTRLESIHDRVELMSEAGAKPTDLSERGPILSPSIFISHSSEDEDVIRVVKQAFEELELIPLFNEKYPAGGPPVEAIVQRIADSRALFAFLTSKSNYGQTRDWITFELGIAKAHGKPIFAWVQNHIQKEQLPRLLEQLTTYRPFEAQTNQGTLKLMDEVRRAAKDLPRPKVNDRHD